MTPRPASRLLTVLAVAALTLSACGDGRPSVEEIEKGVVADDSIFPIPAQDAECAATRLAESKLPDEDVLAVAEADAKHEKSNQFWDFYTETLSECATAG
ncbi:MAG: hypothetical protein QM621_07530 [Aeromicrobium sp.]|uniref:hypothetical protein n=1 Tax=Aeromicrobium sp. TaxID=1871063 RepID=UPI0039E389D8